MPIKGNQLDATTPFVQEEQAGDPTTGANRGSYYTKDFAGVTEAVYRDSAGNVVRLTNTGAVNAAGSGEVNLGANVGTGDADVFRNKTGVTLNFKRLVAGTNVTLNNGADTVTINATGGGGSGAPVIGDERYQVVSTAGEEAYLNTFDTDARYGLSWTRTGTTLTVTSTAHGLTVNDRIIIRGFNVAGAQNLQVVTVPNANSFTVTVSNTGGTSGAAGLYQRGGGLSRSGSTLTLDLPAGVVCKSGSFRMPAAVSSPLIFVYADVGLNTSAADRYPPQISQWREDTNAATIPGSNSAALSASFDRLSITMPSVDRLFKFTF